MSSHSQSSGESSSSESSSSNNETKHVHTDGLINNRLPKDAVPTNYALYIQPHFESATFTGTVAITIHNMKSRDRLLVHSKNLTIKWINWIKESWNIMSELTHEMAKSQKSLPFSEDKENELLVIDLKDQQPPGFYTLIIYYTGI